MAFNESEVQFVAHHVRRKMNIRVFGAALKSLCLRQIEFQVWIGKRSSWSASCSYRPHRFLLEEILGDFRSHGSALSTPHCGKAKGNYAFTAVPEGRFAAFRYKAIAKPRRPVPSKRSDPGSGTSVRAAVATSLVASLLGRIGLLLW